MVTYTGLMRVFWPSDAPRSSLQGVLVGFRNSESDVFVVAILQDVEVRIQSTDGTERRLTRRSLDMWKTLCLLEHCYDIVHTMSRSCSSDAVTPLFARSVS
jgi:hypothetical protein